jgi:hypothetical protein
MVVTQVEKDVVVNKVGKPEVKPRIATFIRSSVRGRLVVFEPAKMYEGFVFEPANICKKVCSNQRTRKRESTQRTHEILRAQLFLCNDRGP